MMFRSRSSGKRAPHVLLGSLLWMLSLVGIPEFTMALEPQPGTQDPFAELRLEMVERQIRKRGVRHQGVLRAMRDVPRHLFVPEELRDQAYSDYPLSIGSGQTISQPYIVALMTELLDLDGDDRVLEIGTGSGYQAAILSQLTGKVYSIEILDTLAERARATLDQLGYSNVNVRTGDGYEGWPEEAPFDSIVVTAAPPEIPTKLLEQLKVGGKMVVPVGEYLQVQDLLEITKTENGTKERRVAPVLFVPMVEPD